MALKTAPELHRVSLRFVDEAAERRFQDQYLRDNLPYIRRAHVVAIAAGVLRPVRRRRRDHGVSCCPPLWRGQTRNHWMMIVCCFPMLAIAGILVATGAASPGFLVAAVGCTVMMALMMWGVGHGGDDRS